MSSGLKSFCSAYSRIGSVTSRSPEPLMRSVDICRALKRPDDCCRVLERPAHRKADGDEKAGASATTRPNSILLEWVRTR